MASGTSSSKPQAPAAQPIVKAVALNHLHLNVRDLERSVRFYKEAFGLVETFRPEPKLAFMSPPGSRDSLALDEASPIGSQGVRHFGFKLEVADLDRAIEQVKRAGGKLVSRGKHAGRFPYAYVADPDGYEIEL